MLCPIQKTLGPVWNRRIGDQIYDGTLLLWPASRLLINSAEELSRSQWAHSAQDAPDLILTTRGARVFNGIHNDLRTGDSAGNSVDADRAAAQAFNPFGETVLNEARID